MSIRRRYDMSSHNILEAVSKTPLDPNLSIGRTISILKYHDLVLHTQISLCFKLLARLDLESD